MKAYYPKNVFFNTLECDSKEWYRITPYYEKSTMWKNKLVAVGKPDEDAKRIINMHTTPWIRPVEEPVIYVAPESKISRDLLRNSGYKITYNRDNCGMIVIPSIIPEDVYVTSFNICVVSHNDAGEVFLSFFAVEGRNNVNNEPVFSGQVAHLIQVCKENRTSHGFTVDEVITNSNTSLKEFSVYTFPKCDEYARIINQEDVDDLKSYCFDTDVKCTAPIDINVDTLTIWKNTDTSILAKAIPSSNWKEYPMTLALFLHTEKQTIRFCSTGNLRKILYEIGFMDLYDKGESSKLVQPKDWKMWSDYLMSKYGVSTEGGFSSRVNVNPLPGVRLKVAVAPFVITEPMSYNNILSTIKVLK